MTRRRRAPRCGHVDAAGVPCIAPSSFGRPGRCPAHLVDAGRLVGGRLDEVRDAVDTMRSTVVGVAMRDAKPGDTVPVALGLMPGDLLGVLDGLPSFTAPREWRAEWFEEYVPTQAEVDKILERLNRVEDKITARLPPEE